MVDLQAMMDLRGAGEAHSELCRMATQPSCHVDAADAQELLVTNREIRTALL